MNQATVPKKKKNPEQKQLENKVWIYSKRAKVVLLMSFITTDSKMQLDGGLVCAAGAEHISRDYVPKNT